MEHSQVYRMSNAELTANLRYYGSSITSPVCGTNRTLAENLLIDMMNQNSPRLPIRQTKPESRDRNDRKTSSSDKKQKPKGNKREKKHRKSPKFSDSHVSVDNEKSYLSKKQKSEESINQPKQRKKLSSSDTYESDTNESEKSSEDEDKKSVKEAKFVPNANNVETPEHFLLWLRVWFFFGFISCCTYTVLMNKEPYIDHKNDVLPICQPNVPGNVPGINCVPREQVNNAKDLLEIILPELITRNMNFKCGKHDTKPYLTAVELRDIVISKKEAVDFNEFLMRLKNLKVLIEHNPKWKIKLVTLNNVNTKKHILSHNDEDDNLSEDQIITHTLAFAKTIDDLSLKLTCIFDQFYTDIKNSLILAILYR